jgi:hypothetical protein
VWWTIRLEIEETVGVSGFAINVGVQSTSVPDDLHVQQRIRALSFYFHGKLDGRS